MKKRLVFFTIILASIFTNTAQETYTLLNKLDSLVVNNHFEKITSIVIAKGEKIVYEKYYNSANENTLHNTRSATKSIAGTLIGIAIKQGLLTSEKENASQFFNVNTFKNPDKRKEQITIEDLLTMSSSLECDDWNNWSRGNEERMYIIEDWSQFYWNLPIKGYPAWATKPKDAKYGRSFSYCTAGTVVLGDIVHKVSGSLEEFADKNLFKKLNITDYKWQKTPKGLPMTGGGLGLKSKDFIKFGQLYLNNGKFNGEQIISKDWIKKSITPKASMERQNIEYGYLFWLQKFGSEEAFYMTGTGGNKIVMFPELDMVVVLTSENYRGGYKAIMNTQKMLEDYIVPTFK